MTGTFAPEEPALFDELLEHVAVAHLGALEADSELCQTLLERVIRHERAEDTFDLAAREHAVSYHHIEKFVAVVDTPLCVGHD